MSDTTPITAEQLLRMPDEGCRYELIAGELRKRSLAGWREGAIAGELLGLLGMYVIETNLGRVLGAGTGFLLARSPDTVRAPDIAFLSKDRLQVENPGEGFWPGAPDLAIEVLSPDHTTAEVGEKVGAWLDAGASMVWVVNPKWRSVTVYRSATEIETLTENDQLDGEDVVPGFRCRVGDIFVNL